LLKVLVIKQAVLPLTGLTPPLFYACSRSRHRFHRFYIYFAFGVRSLSQSTDSCY